MGITAPKQTVVARARPSHVENEIDYIKHTESDLVDMFGRLDPRYAPADMAALFVVAQGLNGLIIIDDAPLVEIAGALNNTVDR